MTDPIFIFIYAIVILISLLRIWWFVRDRRHDDERQRKWIEAQTAMQQVAVGIGVELYLIHCKAAGCVFIARGFDGQLVDADYGRHWLATHAVSAPINDPVALERWLTDD